MKPLLGDVPYLPGREIDRAARDSQGTVLELFFRQRALPTAAAVLTRRKNSSSAEDHGESKALTASR